MMDILWLMLSFYLSFSPMQTQEPECIPWVPSAEDYISETEWEDNVKLMRVTCYLPTGNRTASGQPTHLGGCAGRREDIGKVAAVYTKDHEFVGYFEINDCGGATSLRNGTSIDIFRENMTQAWDWVNTYGDYMYVQIIDSEG